MSEAFLNLALTSEGWGFPQLLHSRPAPHNFAAMNTLPRPESAPDTSPSLPLAERPTRTTDASGAEQALYVVAIGASAGGLDALEKLFASLPPDGGAAFVVIQHLSPDHKSMMASLLSRHTEMPVIMVEDDMPIAANQVFLIPPGSIMHMDQRHLRLTPKSPRTLTLPIDVFFQSLATQFGDKAVGVVLSGTGSDGTRGAGAINEAGGLLIAQDPENAKFDGMPRSVISTGLVDAILPVEAMAQRIVAHIHNQPPPQLDVSHRLRAQSLNMGPDAALAGVQHLLYQLGGINFEEYKPGTVMRRIERRMAVRQVASIESYLALLNEDRAEVLTLRRELLIPVTSFFRDTEAFEALSRQVVDAIVAAKDAGQPIRVWCAGVATGEEAYSVAMLFLEAFEQAKRWPSLKIFATDVEQVNIETAGAGSYPESIAAEISAHQLERFFVRKGSSFVVKNELRQCIVFARHNLLSDPPFTKMDLVVCRNALIYFRSVAQDRVLRRLQYALSPKGFLFLGSSESLGDLQRDFQTLSARHKIWQITRPTSLPLEFGSRTAAAAAYPLVLGTRRHAMPGLNSRVGHSAVEMGFATLLKAFAPPAAMLIDSRHELVHSYGDIQPYMQMREGQASLDINRILADPLVPVAAALLFKVARENSSVTSDVVRLPMSGGIGGDRAAGTLQVKLSAWPVGEVDGHRMSLLAFERVHVSDPSDAPLSIDIDTETSERLELLEHELAATRESLQATIEELETSNEELQATNEEMMASNEELQSSNEELQSVNEELNTVNAEYQEKIEILNRVNADLDNMARAVSAGTVFVDDKLQLTRFSPDAAQIFRLRDTDIGRPLEDLTHTLEYPGLMDDLRLTLSSSRVTENDVMGPGQRHFMVRMLPYQIPSSASRGVVMTFMDVTSLHDAARLQNILDSLSEHIAVLDSGGRILMVNAAWQRFAQANGDPEQRTCTVGVNYLSACNPSGHNQEPSAAAAVAGLRAVLGGERERFSMEYPCHSATEQRWFLMNVTGLGGDRPGAVVSHINVTQWRTGASRGQHPDHIDRSS